MARAVPRAHKSCRCFPKWKKGVEGIALVQSEGLALRHERRERENTKERHIQQSSGPIFRSPCNRQEARVGRRRYPRYYWSCYENMLLSNSFFIMTRVPMSEFRSLWWKRPHGLCFVHVNHGRISGLPYNFNLPSMKTVGRPSAAYEIARVPYTHTGNTY